MSATVPQLVFRDAVPDEAPQLARMNAQLIRDEGHRNRMTIERLTERMAGWLHGEYRAVIFSLDGADLGYALYRRDREWVYIRQFWVDPSGRRRGIGRTAMDWLIEHRWADAPRLRLEVLAGNQRAMAFWRAMGFTDYCLTLERPLHPPQG